MAPLSLGTLIIVLISAILTIILFSSAECYSGQEAPVKFSMTVGTSLMLTDSYCHIWITVSISNGYPCILSLL